MANERLTEGYFRNFVFSDSFYKESKIITEEQASKYAKIDKLMLNAVGIADKKHPFESPVGDIHDFFVCRGAVGKHIVEDIFWH